MSETVAFIGLGVMGYPMAGHLAAKGYSVTAYNRNSAKAEAWTAAPVRRARGRLRAVPQSSSPVLGPTTICAR